MHKFRTYIYRYQPCNAPPGQNYRFWNFWEIRDRCRVLPQCHITLGYAAKEDPECEFAAHSAKKSPLQAKHTAHSPETLIVIAFD